MIKPQPRQSRWPHLPISVLLPVVVVGFLFGIAQPARATSPTATLEAFFARTNTVLEAVDPAHGLETPRHDIRELVNELRRSRTDDDRSSAERIRSGYSTDSEQIRLRRQAYRRGNKQS